MNVSIKNKIYLSFFLPISLFIVSGVYSIITLNNNRKLADRISTVTEPSVKTIDEFEDMLVKSKMYTIDWVFLRSNQEDKDAINKIHDADYPDLKKRLNLLSFHWDDKPSEDSLIKIYSGFEQLLMFEKKIMGSLQVFNDYNNSPIKLQAERIIEDELLSRTMTLTNALDRLETTGHNIIIQKNRELERSFMQLKTLMMVRAIVMICIGILLSLYMTRVIIIPINKIRHIINNLGKGIIPKIDHSTNVNEIGKMIHSVNILSEKLQAAATFAQEVGIRNFDVPFTPLSDKDTLGKALIAMRDNIKSSDEKINQAQHIAHLGTLERDVATGSLYLSDEMFNILDIDPASFDYDFQNILNLVHPEFQDEFKKFREKYLRDSKPGDFECKIITPKGAIKNIIVQSKIVTDSYGKPIRIVGIVQDITERKRVEEKLAQEQELFRLLIENIPDQIYLKDAESRFLLCNMPGAISAGCKSQADIIGKTDFDFFPPENAQYFFDVEQALMKSGKSVINQEEYMPDKTTGEPHWSLNSKVPFKDRNGKTIGLIGINRDITERKISEKKVEDVNRELGILFNSIDEIFFSVNMATLKVIQISPTCEKVYGYKQSEFLANYMLWLDIIHPDDKHVIENEDGQMRRGEQVNNQYRIIRKDKIIRWVETKITPTLDEQGKLIRVDGITRDITKRKEAESELHKSELRYRQIVETAQEGIWIIDENNYIIFFNLKMCELLEYSYEEMKGKQLFDFMDTEGKALATEQVQKRRQKVDGNYDVRYITKSGKAIWTSISTSAIFDDDGKYQGALAMVTDVTARKMAEEERQEILDKVTVSDTLFKEAESIAHFGTFKLDIVAKTTTWSDEMFRLLGYKPGEVEPNDENFSKHIHPDDMFKLGKVLTEKNADICNIDYRVMGENGSARHIRAQFRLERDGEGRLLSIIGINQNITERKNNEEQIRLSNERYELVTKTTNDMIWDWDLVNNRIFRNENYSRVFGPDATDRNAVGKWLIQVHPGDKEWIEDYIKEKLKDPDAESWEIEFRYYRSDHEMVYLNDRGFIIRDENKKAIRMVGATCDITERKKAEEKLIQSEKYNRNLFNQSPVGLALTRMDGTLEDINEAYANIIGRTIEECKMLSFYEITPEKYSAQESACMTVLELTGKYGPYEKEYIHKDGHLVPVRLSGTSLEKEGIKYMWSSVEDITDVKLAEEAMSKSEASLEIKNRELEQKNKELEQFAYVASHDLQEPLRTTISFVELFKQQYFEKLDLKADQYLSYIVQASYRMRVLIEDLLDFSRIGINKAVEKVDCNMVLQDVIADIDKALKDAEAEIEAEYLPVVSGYAVEMKQLFQNLILNSIKFRKKNVPLKIKIEALKKNGYWRFAFTDNGIGIDQQHNERIFIIFQRLHTRSEYQGSGIGLSHCKKIVELHHGKIWVDSKLNEGSTFYFTIHSPKEKINEPEIKLHNAY